jgi:broad specificity phosphatase PhoE
MRLHIIRHAEPDYANNTITPPGHLEAQALSKKLKQLKLDRIYSSPMGRALHTMQYTADVTGLQAEVQDWMMELGKKWYYLDAEGKRHVAWNVSAGHIRSGETLPNHEDWHKREPFDRPELLIHHAELKEQSDQFMLSQGYKREGGQYKILRPNQENIAIFCHHGFGLAWLAHLLELPITLVWAGFWLPPSSVTTVLMDEVAEGWAVPRCLGLGDVSHIYESGLPVSHMGLQNNIQ